MVFKVLPTHIDAEFHGESISDGFRAIRVRKVGQKLKKPGGNRQTRFSGHPPPKSLSNYPASDCSEVVSPFQFRSGLSISVSFPLHFLDVSVVARLVNERLVPLQ